MQTKHKFNRSLFGCGLMILLFAHSIAAQTTEFTYQGRLNSGVRANVYFGFTVNNRFVSLTKIRLNGNTDLTANVGTIAFTNSTTVQTAASGTDSDFFIYVF